jgi:hypothetical protein
MQQHKHQQGCFVVCRATRQEYDSSVPSKQQVVAVLSERFWVSYASAPDAGTLAP